MIRYPISLGKVTKHWAVLLISVGIVASQPLAFGKDAQAAKGIAKGSAPAVTTTKSNLPKIIEMGAVWCVPCKQLKPIFERAQAKYGSKADFQEIDFDSTEGQLFAEKHNISSVPTILVINGKGKIVYQHSGLIDEATLTTQIKKVLP